jgi:archaellum component FlaC
MKQQPSQFGQARQLAELRQQIKELQAQNAKLTADLKTLRDTDRKIFDEQDKQIADLKELVTALADGLQDCFDNEYSLEQLNGLKVRAQSLLAKEH